MLQSGLPSVSVCPDACLLGLRTDPDSQALISLLPFTKENLSFPHPTIAAGSTAAYPAERTLTPSLLDRPVQ
jgi:hypothetical protein